MTVELLFFNVKIIFYDEKLLKKNNNNNNAIQMNSRDWANPKYVYRSVTLTPSPPPPPFTLCHKIANPLHPLGA